MFIESPSVPSSTYSIQTPAEPLRGSELATKAMVDEGGIFNGLRASPAHNGAGRSCCAPCRTTPCVVPGIRLGHQFVLSLDHPVIVAVVVNFCPQCFPSEVPREG